MPLYGAQDPALDGWSAPPGDLDPSPPQSGVRAASRTGTWLTRLFDAGAWMLKGSRRDPEPRALLEAAEILEHDGGVVFADLDGWPRPPVVQGFVPDLYAVFEDREIVLDFVNEESVLRDTSRRKDLAFAAWAAASPRRIYEQVLVEGGRGGRS